MKNIKFIGLVIIATILIPSIFSACAGSSEPDYGTVELTSQTNKTFGPPPQSYGQIYLYG